jgi:hypothetical protein
MCDDGAGKAGACMPASGRSYALPQSSGWTGQGRAVTLIVSSDWSAGSGNTIPAFSPVCR